MQGPVAVAVELAAPVGCRSAPSHFWVTHFALPLVAFIALMLALSTTSLDLSFANSWAYDGASQRWIGRGRWWAEVLLHRDGRDAILLVLLVLLALLALGFVSKCVRASRGTVMYLLITISLGWGLVGGLKHVTNVACPWDLQNFGGDRPYVSLFEARPLGYEPEACFPGAHSGSGFSLFAFYFALRDRRRGAARIALSSALATGALFAFGQEARGAHFLSHDLCSAFVVWFAALATYVAWRSCTGGTIRRSD